MLQNRSSDQEYRLERDASKELEKPLPANLFDQNRNASKSHLENSTTGHLVGMANTDTELSLIQRFYSGANVFVTGATGFMGKVLIEKLLRSCPGIENIYIMVREKKGRSVDGRIDDLIQSPCFDRIKKESPDFRCKIHAIAADVGLEDLGISEADRHLLEQQVDIVFHVAATVRFDEHLKLAILQNVRGTREVLNLCRTFQKLKSVVHVSTAYSNCPSKYIGECLYPSPLASDHAIKLAETHEVTTLDRLSHKLVGKWPNTYSFTKAISEDIVLRYGQGLPVAIFRPAVVICTRSEPIPGWIDNLYGPSGVLVGCASGLLRTMRANRDTEANIVPCDMTINAMIASAWDVVENREACEMPVYNYVCPRYNPLTWQSYLELYTTCVHNYPPSKALWYSTMTISNNKFLYYLVRLMIHFLPALLMDIGFLATGKAPQMIKIYNKIHRFTNVIQYFCTQQWDFDLSNVEGMWRRLKDKDKELFFFNMDALNWTRFVTSTCVGLRTSLLKDPPETLPQARKMWARMYFLHCTLKFLTGIFLIWVLFAIQPHVAAVIHGLKERLLSGFSTLQ